MGGGEHEYKCTCLIVLGSNKKSFKFNLNWHAVKVRCLYRVQCSISKHGHNP